MLLSSYCFGRGGQGQAQGQAQAQAQRGLSGTSMLSKRISCLLEFCVVFLLVVKGIVEGGVPRHYTGSHFCSGYAIRYWLSAIFSPIGKVIGVCLILFSLLLIVGCGGGGGGGGSSSGGSGPDNIIMVDNGTGGGANGTGPAKAQWAILAQTNLEGNEEIAIRWHNVKSFESAGARRFSVEYTVDGQEREPFSDTLSAFDHLYNTFNATGLIGEAGKVYKFGPNITVTYANGTVYTLPIEWGTGDDFTPFVDEHGSDGVAIPSDMPLVVVDPGGSICRITDDAADCDGDGLNNTADACPAGQSGWAWAMGGNTDDDDGDGCHNDEDIDDDGDGLIEISTAEELYEVRYQLDGTGRRLMDSNDPASLNQTGCGGEDGRDECNGYELTGDIDLSTFSDGEGWLPIGDYNPNARDHCAGGEFIAIFDGNNYKVTGLFINRPGGTCVGLFGDVVGGSIRNLGVIASNITGRRHVGSLVGYGPDANITQSYGITKQVTGMDDSIGGLVGWGQRATIVQSYAVSGTINSIEGRIGGLVGYGDDATIVQSYAVSETIQCNISPTAGGITALHGCNDLGGLVGDGGEATIVQSYAVSGMLNNEHSFVGGLVGDGEGVTIIQSYAVSEEGHSRDEIGGLAAHALDTKIVHSYATVGELTVRLTSNPSLSGLVESTTATSVNDDSAQASYWDSNTSGIEVARFAELPGAEPKTTDELRSPTNFTTGIYETWDDGPTIDGVDIAALTTTGTRWCDTDLSGAIEGDEDEDDNRVWDLGTAMQYPAIRCTPDSPDDQRAWWSLNATGKPELDRVLLDDWLDGSPP